MSSDLFLHEFVRMLISSYTHDATVHKGMRGCGKHHGPLLHKLASSTASTAVSSCASPLDNVILIDDIERMRIGKESRTTLMIKRVPRKYVHSAFSCYKAVPGTR